MRVLCHTAAETRSFKDSCCRGMVERVHLQNEEVINFVIMLLNTIIPTKPINKILLVIVTHTTLPIISVGRSDCSVWG